jgi:hypothetical protein
MWNKKVQRKVKFMKTAALSTSNKLVLKNEMYPLTKQTKFRIKAAFYDQQKVL